MGASWRRLHLWLGLAGVVVFLGTGLYMRTREPPVAELESGLRMLFRSRHIYLLLTGLLNLALGLHLALPEGGWARRIAVAGSALVALAPLLALGAFFVDAEILGAPGPLGYLAIESAFAGGLLGALGGWWGRRQSGAESPPAEEGR